MLIDIFYWSNTKVFIFYYNLFLCCIVIFFISSSRVLSSPDFFLLGSYYFINCSLWILLALPSTCFFFVAETGENLSTFFSLENFNLSLLFSLFIYLSKDSSFVYILLVSVFTFVEVRSDFLSFLSGK